MISNIFNAILFQPFYNGLIFLISIIPGNDVGVAVILFTIFIRAALFSVSFRSVKAQARLREIAPEIEKIKEKFKDDKQKQASEIMNFYKQEGVNPLSSVFSLLLQIPVMLALYFVFLRGLPDIIPDMLYSFSPQIAVNMTFLGLIDISGKSVVLAVIAGAGQFMQAHLMSPKSKKDDVKKKEDKDKKPSLGSDLAKSMQVQMKYVFPAIIGFVAYNFGGAVALYLVVSSLFSVAQEIYVKKHGEREKSVKTRDI